ncbi:unnamed protein product [Moneuplotes crassus]|uniref:Major facilitator superfamily (MFS) profile domain-containing protein n=1 Tax=Euplotes crassus TaxID=5936 RepID=A0AAD1XNN0_EUPCR|nr:unnamed protein product [Moneuplotes crassus]
MDDYHQILDSDDGKDCYDQNREADLTEFKRYGRDGGINKCLLTIIFIHAFCTNILINFDHGTIPAAVTHIKTELDIDNANMGILGSLVYAGITFGALFTAQIYKIFNPKYVLSASLILNAVSLILFPLSQKFWVLCLSRALVGVCQTFTCVFVPIWIDIFAPKSRKTIWLTLSQLAVPLGVVVGYSITSICMLSMSWRVSFYIQSGAFVPIGLLFLLYPNKYFSYLEFNSNKENIDNNLSESRSKYSYDSEDDADDEFQFLEGETGHPCSIQPKRGESFHRKLSTSRGPAVLLSSKRYPY